MKQQLILLRGNSGSGKTTIANELQQKLGYTTMVVSQDVIRRDILHVKDFPGNPAIQLIYDTLLYGKSIGYTVILEGILTNRIYSEMLIKLIKQFNNKARVYYFDIPFEETIYRHKTKANTTDFDEEDMKQWWVEKDYLQVVGEQIITPDMSKEDIVSSILHSM